MNVNIIHCGFEGGGGGGGVCNPPQGRIQDFGKGGGSDKYIYNWGEGKGVGVPPPVTARGR